MAVSEEKKEKGADCLFKEIVAENFPNLGNEMDIQIQGSSWIPNKMNSEIHPEVHYNLIVKSPKEKRILKSAREKQLVSCKETAIPLSVQKGV